MNNQEVSTAYVGSTEIKEARLGTQLVLAPGGDALWYKANEIPTLDLRFAENESLVDATTGANLVTFSRASGGTYVDSQGVIRNAVTNLLLRSEEFDNASWIKTAITVSSNVSSAPNGTVTADKLIEDTSAGGHVVIQSSAQPDNTTLTSSCYCKAAERDWVAVTVVDKTGALNRKWFNLTTGQEGSTNGTVSGFSATDVGNGWYRIAVSASSAVGATTPQIRISLGSADNTASYTGDGTSGLYVWGAQLEQSSTVGEYIPTTSSINSAPRFDHDPETGESLGLLVEEERENLLLRSEEFDTTWVASSGTVSANATFAPNGTQTADSFTPDNAATLSNASVAQVHTKAASSIAYAASFYAKAGGYNEVAIALSDSGSIANRVVATFSLATGAQVGSTTQLGTYTAGTVSTSALADGWYRINVNVTTSTETGIRYAIFATDSSTTTGDGTSGIYIWGAQLEEGSFPTSYIPTEGTTATRAADVAQISGSNFSSWYRQDEGTFYADVLYRDKLANTRLFFTQETSPDFNSRHGLVGGGNSTASIGPYGETVIAAASQTSGLNQGSPATNTRYKTVFAFAEDNFAFTRNGATPVTDDSGNVPTSQGMAWIGQSDGANYMCSPIKRLVFWPTRLGDEVLQRITQ